MDKKVILIGRDPNSIRNVIEKMGFIFVKENPDFVISYGGDGTLMGSEFAHPGIPKIILKGSLVCKKASPFSNEVVLEKIKNDQFRIEPMEKLFVSSKEKELVALNDIVIHNKNPRHAIRYILSVNNKQIGKEIIGDGVVVSTPFGSTGYYRSITDSFFEVGIGLAFNNSTEQSDHIVLKPESVIHIRITRGPAMIYADNQEDEIELLENDEATIKLSGKIANIVVPFD